MSIITRITRWSVGPERSPLYGVHMTDIEIVDECGGEFVMITQHREEEHQISFDSDEWPKIREVIDNAFKEIKKHEEKEVES